MVFWNSLELREPPTQTCRVSTVMFLRKDLLNIQAVCSTASLTLNTLKQLHSEAAMLSRILYKMKRKFRLDKGFKKLEKVNRGLLKYLVCNFASVYAKFASTLPQCSEEFEVELPTRQMLEWVLVRTQGFGKLFCIIADTCEETSCFWKDRIQRGHMWAVSLMIMGIVSRIWSYSKYLVQNSCEWFRELRPYLPILQPKGRAWLPEGYEIPEDLKIWLKAPHITNISHMKKPCHNKTDTVFGLIQLEDSDINNSEKPGLPISTITQSKLYIHSTGIEDFGEVISRTDLETVTEISRKNKRKRINFIREKKIDESQFDSKTNIGSTTVGSQNAISCTGVYVSPKKAKKQNMHNKGMVESVEYLQSNTSNTLKNKNQPKLLVKIDKVKRKKTKQAHPHASTSEQQYNANIRGPEILTVTESKKKKISKNLSVGHQLNHATLSNSNSPKTLIVTDRQKKKKKNHSINFNVNHKIKSNVIMSHKQIRKEKIISHHLSQDERNSHRSSHVPLLEDDSLTRNNKQQKRIKSIHKMLQHPTLDSDHSKSFQTSVKAQVGNKKLKIQKKKPSQKTKLNEWTILDA